MIHDATYLRIGIISGAHGLNGRLKILIITDVVERFSEDNPVYLKEESGYKKYIIEHFSITKGKYALLQLDGLHDRNIADLLKGTELYIKKDDAERTRKYFPDAETFYYYDLIGCTVYWNNKEFGAVSDIFEAGTGEILVITDMEGKERMVPFVEAMVDTARVREKRIDINPVEGLFDF